MAFAQCQIDQGRPSPVSQQVDLSWLTKNPKRNKSDGNTAARKKRQRPGRPAVRDDFPEIVPAAKNFIESNGFQAHRRRREATGTCGSTLPEIKEHLLDTIPNLRDSYPKLDDRTVAHLLQPPNRGRRIAAAYKGLVDARVATKDNSARKGNENSQFYSARVKYCLEMASKLGERALVYSADNKNKIRISDDSLAVDRRITIRRFFPATDAPRYWDHDFPTPGYALTPAGYLKLTPSPGFTIDQLGRQHYELPKKNKATVVLRSPHSDNNIASHMNDLSPLVGSDTRMLVLLVDGGPDFNPNHATNIYYFGRYFRDSRLDSMIVTTYCPGDSAYNPIEHVWAPCTQALTGVYLPSTLPGEDKPPCRQNIPEEEKRCKEHQVFNSAMTSIRDGYWRKVKFGGSHINVKCEPSGGEPTPYGRDISDIKAALGGSARQLQGSPFYDDYLFVHQHADRRIGMVVFAKCKDQCPHCQRYPPALSEDEMATLRKFPSPSPDSEHPGHFKTFVESLEDSSTTQPCEFMPTFQEKGLGRCLVANCRYVFTSKKDANDHRLRVH